MCVEHQVCNNSFNLKIHQSSGGLGMGYILREAGAEEVTAQSCCVPLPPAPQIFFNYGSEKPFEHMKQERQREEREKREKEQRRNVCNYAWVPNS